MKEMLHAIAAALVITAAAILVLVQLSSANHAVDRLGQDERGVIQPVNGDPGRGAPDRR